MAQTTDNNNGHTIGTRAPRLGRPPFWLVAVAIIFTIGSWVPLVFMARGRVIKSDAPPVLFVQDMHVQPKYREQQSSDVFADGRADRPRVEGTVARGTLDLDDHYFRGWTKAKAVNNDKPEPKFFDQFPSQVTVDAAFVKRGQERYQIYCAACHGKDGYGNGPVNARARELQQGSWIQPSNVTVDPQKSRAVGHIFNTITVGIRNMPGYGAQIPVQDRWAIVAYVRALQLSQNAPELGKP